MFNFFDWIIEFLLTTIPSLLTDFFMWCLSFIGGIVLKVINIIFEYVIPFLNYEDFEQVPIWDGITGAWNSLPHEILQLCSYCQVPEAISIVTMSLLVKFIKQKVPFLK